MATIQNHAGIFIFPFSIIICLSLSICLCFDEQYTQLNATYSFSKKDDLVQFLLLKGFVCVNNWSNSVKTIHHFSFESKKLNRQIGF